MKTIKLLSILFSLNLILSGMPAFTLESATLDHAAKMNAGGLDKGYENSQFSRGEASVDARAGGVSHLQSSPAQKEKSSAPSLGVGKIPKPAKKFPQPGNGSTANFYFWAPVFIGACVGGPFGVLGVLAGAAVGAAIGWSLTN